MRENVLPGGARFDHILKETASVLLSYAETTGRGTVVETTKHQVLNPYDWFTQPFKLQFDRSAGAQRKRPTPR
jgi:hypothetical protein